MTKSQALKEMKKAAAVFKKEVSKILEDNDLFYCIDTDVKDRVSTNNRGVNDMIYSLMSRRSLVGCMIMRDLKTRKEALKFGYH